MPYQLKQVGPNKYYVITKDTGKAHSHLPMTYDKALAQFRLLESLYRKERK